MREILQNVPYVGSDLLKILVPDGSVKYTGSYTEVFIEMLYEEGERVLTITLETTVSNINMRILDKLIMPIVGLKKILSTMLEEENPSVCGY